MIIINKNFDKKFKKEMAKKFKPYDVTLEHWSLLTRLWKQDSVSQTELAIKTNKDLPTVTRCLNKLIKKGLIEKKVIQMIQELQ